MYAQKVVHRPPTFTFKVIRGAPRLSETMLGVPADCRSPLGREGVAEALSMYLKEIKRHRFLTREEELCRGRQIAESFARLARLVLGTRPAQEEATALIGRVAAKEIQLESAIDAFFSEKGGRKTFLVELRRRAAFLARNLEHTVGLAKRLGREQKNDALRHRLERRTRVGTEVLLRLGIRGTNLNRWALNVIEEGRAVRAGRSPVGSPPMFESAGEFLARAEEIESALLGYREAKGALVVGNLWLVVNIARRHMNRGLPLLDLIGEGNLGLLRAAEKYDHRKGNKFSTYATWWIIQAIRGALADKSRAIRLPSNALEVMSKISRRRAEMAARGGNEPEWMDAARDLAILSEDKVEKIFRAKQPLRSLDRVVADGDDRTLIERLEDPKGNVSDAEETGDGLRTSLEALLEELKPQEREVIRMRYGIGQERSHRLSEIAEQFKISKERVRQVEINALHRLRMPSRRAQLVAFIKG